MSSTRQECLQINSSVIQGFSDGCLKNLPISLGIHLDCLLQCKRGNRSLESFPTSPALIYIFSGGRDVQAACNLLVCVFTTTAQNPNYSYSTVQPHLAPSSQIQSQECNVLLFSVSVSAIRVITVKSLLIIWKKKHKTQGKYKVTATGRLVFCHSNLTARSFQF